MTNRPTNRDKRGYIHARVMVIVLDTSSECALLMYEVSLKYLQLDGWLRMGLLPPLGNFADISYLVEN